jgi:hypothetical protein
MEIPILLGASPKTANPVEWIPIRFDRWGVRVEGLVDSIITLHSNTPFNYIDISKLDGEVLNGPVLVRAKFVKRGTEANISIFAKEHHGD